VIVCARSPSTELLSLVSRLNSLTLPDYVKLDRIILVLRTNAESKFLGEISLLRLTCGVSILTGAGFEIPASRNLGLDEALRFEADWIAWVDDDCWPAADWLLGLFDTVKRTDCEIVAGSWSAALDGPVSPYLPARIWELDDYRLSGRRPRDLEELPTAYTRNVMHRGAISELRTRTLRFDEERGSSGGTDVIFFSELRALGYRICFSERGHVRERFAGERLRFRWHFRRRVRNAQLVLDRFRGQTLGTLLPKILEKAAPRRHLYSAPFSDRATRDSGDLFRARLGAIVLDFASLVGIATWLAGARYSFYSNSWTWRGLSRLYPARPNWQ